MSFGEYVELTDPATIRAIAHPARVRLLAALDDGPATATECAEVVGASPSACSYHLRILGELGFIEEIDSDDGRTRRWRLRVRGHGIPKDAQLDPEVQAAARLWGEQWVAVEQRRLADFLATEGDEPPEWRRAATFASEEVHLTPDELVEVGRRMMDVLSDYADRREPGDRPVGTRPVHISLTAVPRARPGARPSP